MAFDFTTERATLSNNLWAITSAVGAGLCLLVLIVTAVVWCHRRSRDALDRVSFRLVIFALIANTAFGISSAVGGKLTGPGFICGFSIFVLQLTLQLSSFLLFSIALNLLLVVVYNKDGRWLEKFYIIGSIGMATVLTVPPYAAGQYGWDILEKDCWYTNDNKKQRLAWQLGTQMIWTALTVIGELVASVCVMVFMIKHRVRRRRVYASAGSFQGSRGADSVIIRANTYKSIILRIALYPLASCLVNLLSIFTALHSTVSDGIHDTTDYNILLLSDFLYGGRAIVYALLAATDPALVRGVKSFLSIYFPGMASSFTGTDSKHSYQQASMVSKPVLVHIELSTIHDEPSPANGKGDSKDGRHMQPVPSVETLHHHDPEAKGHVEFADGERPRVPDDMESRGQDSSTRVTTIEGGLSSSDAIRQREIERKEGDEAFKRKI